MIKLVKKANIKYNYLMIGVNGQEMAYIRSIIEKTNGYLSITIDKPKRKRTTGKDSQNHHINGHIQQIAAETGNDFDVVKMHCKTQAISMGYPFKTMCDNVYPKSESEISMDEAAILIDYIHRFAAEYNIRLVEK